MTPHRRTTRTDHDMDHMSPNPNRNPRNQTRQILVDANVLAATYDAAANALDEAQAGWPDHTPGASTATPAPPSDCHPCATAGINTPRPCSDHGDDVHLTATERNASTPDRARRDLDDLHEHIRQAAHHTARAAIITNRYGWAAPNETQVRDALAAIDGAIWCEHCIRFGEHNPREQGRKLCSFCRQFEKDWKRRPSASIWSARNARGGRIDVATIQRILANDKAEAKADKETSRAERRKERGNA